MADLLLNIAAISRRTGVAPDTLRKWELRYGVLRPVRTAGGQRRYDETDVQRVEWLRDRINEGWRIGEAARILDGSVSVALEDPTELLDALVAAIGDMDLVTLSAVLDQAFAVLPLEQVLSHVVAPALCWAGDAWHRGELSIAQEHAISGKVRAHLDKLVSGGQGEIHGVAVLACAPGELHDIGLLMLAVMLRADGWRVEYLGADTPVDAAIALGEAIGARILCFSAARTGAVGALREALGSEKPAPGLTIVGGGAALTAAIAKQLGLTYVGGTLDDAVRRLRRLRKQ